MRRNSHETSFGGIIARLLMSLSAFLLLLSYASMVVNPAKAWYMTVFGLLFVPIAILNGIFLVIAIRKGSSSFMIPLLALLPSVIFIGRYFQFSSGAEEKGSETVDPEVTTWDISLWARLRNSRMMVAEPSAPILS